MATKQQYNSIKITARYTGQFYIIQEAEGLTYPLILLPPKKSIFRSMMAHRRKLGFIIFFIYYAVLFKLIILKDIGFLQQSNHFTNYGSHYIDTGYARANFIPFNTIYYYASEQENYGTGFLNLGGNFFLFLPFGIFLQWLYPHASYRRLGVIILLNSLFFECLQLIIAYGTFDVDDMLLNTAGGLTGAYLLKRILKKLKAGRSSVPV